VISLFGAVEGLALGTLFGWAIVAVLHSQASLRGTRIARVPLADSASPAMAATKPGAGRELVRWWSQRPVATL
jgi:hypothetical protein